ncbi:MAG: type 1 glutamine amidotransferase [Acidimicrobiales bacterium]
MPPDDVSDRRPRALVVVHEPYGGAAEVASRLVSRGIDVVAHQVTERIDRPDVAAPFPPLDGFDLVLPMGSVRSVVTREGIDSWIDEEIHLVGEAHERGIPVLGVCFGGQLLAAALGGSVERAPVPEIGWYEIAAPTGVVNPVGPGPWLEWHYDRFEPPPDSEVLAVTEHATQLFRVGSAVGTQFHPEVNLAHLETWIRLSDDTFFEQENLDREVMLAEAAANEAANIDRCRHLVDWFLDDVAQLSLSASPASSAAALSSTSDAEFMQ